MARPVMGMKLVGVQEVKEVFEDLTPTLQRKSVKQTLTESAQPMVDAAKSFAPVREGKLRAGITVFPTLGKRHKKDSARTGRDVTAVYVGPSYVRGDPNYAPHAHLLEWGHRLVRKGREIGFVRPFPFIRPAFDSTKKAVVNYFGVKFGPIVEATAAKLAARRARAAARKASS